MHIRILKLHPEEYLRYGSGFVPDGTRRGEPANRIILVAEYRGEPIGEGALVFENNDRDYTVPGRRGYLSRVLVKDGFRGRGVGSALVDAAVQYAKQSGLAELTVGVGLDHPSTLGFYQKRGFRELVFEGRDAQGPYRKLLRRL